VSDSHSGERRAKSFMSSHNLNINRLIANKDDKATLDSLRIDVRRSRL